jgi:hypothetical protein
MVNLEERVIASSPSNFSKNIIPTQNIRKF